MSLILPPFYLRLIVGDSSFYGLIDLEVEITHIWINVKVYIDFVYLFIPGGTDRDETTAWYERGASRIRESMK